MRIDLAPPPYRQLLMPPRGLVCERLELDGTVVARVVAVAEREGDVHLICLSLDGFCSEVSWCSQETLVREHRSREELGEVKRELMSEFTDEFGRRFRRWLNSQHHRQDPVGWFARDVATLRCRLRDDPNKLAQSYRRQAVAEFVRSSSGGGVGGSRAAIAGRYRRSDARRSHAADDMAPPLQEQMARAPAPSPSRGRTMPSWLSFCRACLVSAQVRLRRPTNSARCGWLQGRVA
jgi:hypothetical protein